MLKTAVTIKIWKAEHVTKGSKFYQVIRFISENGRSFSLRQNGPTAVYVGLGKMSTGSITLDEERQDSKAGETKIAEKVSGGYTKNVDTNTYSMSSVEMAVEWAQNHLGASPLKTAQRILRSPTWAESSVVDDLLDQIAEPEVFAVTEKSEHWGSW